MDPRLSQIPVVDVEIGPLERKLAVVYVSDVHFDEGVTLSVGDRLGLRDVDGTILFGVTEAVESGAFCSRYRVVFNPSDARAPISSSQAR